MTPRDWFGVVVRGSGLYLLIIAVGQAIHVIAERDTLESNGSHVLFCVAYLVFGLVALRGADMIVRFAYPEPGGQSLEDAAPPV